MAREGTPSISLVWYPVIHPLALHPFCALLSKKVGSSQASPNGHYPAVEWQSYLSSTRSGIKFHCAMSTSMPGLILLTVPRCLRTIRSPDQSSRAVPHQGHCGTQKAHGTCRWATVHPGVPHLHPMSGKGSSRVSPTGSAPLSTAYPSSSRRPGTWRTGLRHVRRRCTMSLIRTRPTCPSTNSDARSTPRSPSGCSAASSGVCRQSNRSAPASSRASAPPCSSAPAAEALALLQSRRPPPHPHARRPVRRWSRSTTPPAAALRVRARSQVAATASTDRACPPNSARSFATPSVRGASRAPHHRTRRQGPRPRDPGVGEAAAAALSPRAHPRAAGATARRRTRCSRR